MSAGYLLVFTVGAYKSCYGNGTFINRSGQVYFIFWNHIFLDIKALMYLLVGFEFTNFSCVLYLIANKNLVSTLGS